MALTDPFRWLFASRALDLAEGLRCHAEAQGLPPPVLRLDARPRAAFDRLVDTLNRLPRPIATLGTLALLAAALIAPDWFAVRIGALSRMPEALWWLIGAVLSLHFGARVQDHAQEFQREVLSAAVPPPEPAPSAGTPSVAAPGPDVALTLDTLSSGSNAALADWRRGQA